MNNLTTPGTERTSQVASLLKFMGNLALWDRFGDVTFRSVSSFFNAQLCGPDLFELSHQLDWALAQSIWEPAKKVVHGLPAGPCQLTRISRHRRADYAPRLFPRPTLNVLVPSKASLVGNYSKNALRPNLPFNPDPTCTACFHVQPL